jgi:hypothetical protein
MPQLMEMLLQAMQSQVCLMPCTLFELLRKCVPRKHVTTPASTKQTLPIALLLSADVLSRNPSKPPPGIDAESWLRTTTAAQAKWRTSSRQTPNKLMSPDFVVSTVLKALRHNDDPYTDHGCEVAIRFSASGNPASSMTPSQMRRYLSDSSMPFYR